MDGEFRRIASVVALAFALLGCQSQPKPEPKLTRQRLSPVQIFDLRTKCQAIVEKELQDSEIGVVGVALTANITSHYNPPTNHCYAEVVILKNFGYNYPQTPSDYRSIVLYDAQTKDVLMSIQQEGGKRSGLDFTQEPNFSEYEKVDEKIHQLMTQEDEPR